MTTFNLAELRAAKLTAQQRLHAARVKLSQAQSEFQKARRAERQAVQAYLDAYDLAMGAQQ